MDLEVQAFPAKRFFVEMLTRDIELQDAILDLLDNCVDGVMREQKGTQHAERPYEGYSAKIEFDKERFSISDNCGGIPRGVALERAFRLGRPDRETDRDLPTVGVYGIGMKRAIFKLGRQAVVRSNTTVNTYEVEISPEWLDNDNIWKLPIKDKEKDLGETGTKISVADFNSGIARLLSNETGFEEGLKKSISSYYGNIIQKGFSVYVNDEKIQPSVSSFILNTDSLSTGKGIAPYVYIGEYDGVDIEIVVGFYRNLPTEEEQESSLRGGPTTEQAGWTIICNDRVVLHADKTKVTGWGEAGVPQYHTQFVSISGVVNFRSKDASMLPITTTKRGIDGNSELYLSVKEFMREGVKIFTDYTNKWKKPSKERPELEERAKESTTGDIKRMIGETLWTDDRKSLIKGKRFKPNLPVPKVEKEYMFLRFSKSIEDIKLLGDHFFDDPDYLPGEIGSVCFDEVLKGVKE